MLRNADGKERMYQSFFVLTYLELRIPLITAMTGASTSSSPRVSKELKTKQELEELVESYDNWLFDCDGGLDGSSLRVFE